MSITIYHNPGCGTSRNVLGLIRNSGVEPTIVEYLQTPLDKVQLLALQEQVGVTIRQLLRVKCEPYQVLNLDSPHWSDDQIVDFMVQHPVLLERPVVVTPLGAKLCRPSEVVLDILPNPQQGAFNKEDGEPVIDAQGKRISKD